MPLYPIPSQFGEFQLQEFLGEGLSGEVYRARHNRDGTMVALKLFNKRNDSTVLGYFSNEQLLLRELGKSRKHTHLVEYVASNLSRRPYYLATRYVEGAISLSTLVGKPHPPGFVVRVIEQAASALDYMHYGVDGYSPIIHRDVKPANLLLNSQGNIVVIDLSISSHPNHTVDVNLGLGTPQYMAPEQYTGEEVPATDQFSLAAVAFHLLTGKPLLPTNHRRATKRLQELEQSRYSAVREALAKRRTTADVLVQALAANPAERYETCSMFADALREALLADGASLGEQAPVVAAERDSRLSYAAIVGVALLAIAILFFGRPKDVGGSTSPPTPLAALPLLPPTSTIDGMDGQAMVPTSAVQGQQQPIAPAEPDGSGPQVRIVSNEPEPVREQPKDDAPALAELGPGEMAAYLGTVRRSGNTSWYKIRVQGQEGWCRKGYCELVANTVAPRRGGPTSTMRFSTLLPEASVTPSPRPTLTSVPVTVAPSRVVTRRPVTSVPPTEPPTEPPATITPIPLLMPDLRGLHESEAVARLMALGVPRSQIIPDHQTRARAGDMFDRYPAFTVISTNPGAGSVITLDMTFALGIRGPDEPLPTTEETP